MRSPVALFYALLGKEKVEAEKHAPYLGTFGAGGASGATGYLKNSKEVARVRRVSPILVAALGRPIRHGCRITEPECPAKSVRLAERRWRGR